MGSSKTEMVSVATGSFAVSLPPNMAASWLPWLPFSSSCSACTVCSTRPQHAASIDSLLYIQQTYASCNSFLKQGSRYLGYHHMSYKTRPYPRQQLPTVWEAGARLHIFAVPRSQHELLKAGGWHFSVASRFLVPTPCTHCNQSREHSIGGRVTRGF